jgi:hypothetical protein
MLLRKNKFKIECLKYNSSFLHQSQLAIRIPHPIMFIPKDHKLRRLHFSNRTNSTRKLFNNYVNYYCCLPSRNERIIEPKLDQRQRFLFAENPIRDMFLFSNICKVSKRSEREEDTDLHLVSKLSMYVVLTQLLHGVVYVQRRTISFSRDMCFKTSLN